MVDNSKQPQRPINPMAGKSATDIIKSVLMKAGQWYIEPVKTLALAAAGMAKVTFTNQDTVPFLIQKIVGYGQDVATLAKTFDYSVTFKDSARSEILMSGACHGSFLGSGDFPTELPVPYFLGGSSTFEVEINSLAAAAINVYVTFIGYKLKNVRM